MQRVKLSPNFYLDELVCPEMYQHFGEKARWFIRPEAIRILQHLRDRFRIMTINNWSQYGTVSAEMYLAFDSAIALKYFTQSGLRPWFITIDGKQLLNPVGAQFSQHKFGSAFDPKFTNATPAEVRLDIIKHFASTYKPLGLTTIEANTKGWLHFDCRNTNLNELFIVYP